MKILGLSAYYHDSAACLVIDGEIIAAAQEERFTRKKHDFSFPEHANAYCLSEARIGAVDLDYVVFYDKPFLKFERLFETFLAFAPRGFKSFSTSLPVWVKDKLFQRSMITTAFSEVFGDAINWEAKLLFSEHHLSSAITASRLRRANPLRWICTGRCKIQWRMTSLCLSTFWMATASLLRE